jgi:F-type H+-transporting ATPase subunit gamma
MKGEIDAVYWLYPLHQHDEAGAGVRQLLPLPTRPSNRLTRLAGITSTPDAKAVIDELLMRYVEALIYQAVAENMASEQSAHGGHEGRPTTPRT